MSANFPGNPDSEMRYRRVQPKSLRENPMLSMRSSALFALAALLSFTAAQAADITASRHERCLEGGACRRNGIPCALQGAGGDQHHAIGGLVHRCLQCHEGATPRSRFHRRAGAGRRSQGLAEARQPRRLPAGQRSEAQAHPAAGTHRRGRSQSRRLGARSVQAGRGKRLLLCARRIRRQGHGGGVRRLDGALQARRL